MRSRELPVRIGPITARKTSQVRDDLDTECQTHVGLADAPDTSARSRANIQQLPELFATGEPTGATRACFWTKPHESLLGSGNLSIP